MRIAMFSDLHGKASLPRIKKGTDVICIAGDIVPMVRQRYSELTYKWIRYKFFRWVRNQDAARIIMIAGNHDVYLDSEDHPFRELIRECHLENKLIYLEDESYVYEGIKFYGTPWVKNLPRWAYNTTDLALKFDMIEDCDVLISHSAPNYDNAGTSDYNREYARNFGSDELTAVLMRKKIRINICGHIHTGKHGGIRMERYDGSECMIYNVSMVNEDYDVFQIVQYIDIEKMTDNTNEEKG